MATQATLRAQLREATGKNANRKLRASGRVPAVVYGHGESTRMLTVDAHELDLLFKKVHWENTLIEIDIDGEAAPVRTLVKEVQAHAHRPFIFHVDFQQIHAGELIHVEVPIRLHGTPAGVREGGVLMQAVTDLQIRCTPDRIPEFFDIDVSHLGMNEAVHLSDLTMPEGVEAEIDADRTICSVTPPAGAISAASGEGEDEAEAASTEPEVIRKAREEDA